MNIAEPLKRAMEEKGISRSRLGREIGVHTSTVSNWLDGKDVKLENLATLCSYFGCSMDYFAGDGAGFGGGDAAGAGFGDGSGYGGPVRDAGTKAEKPAPRAGDELSKTKYEQLNAENRAAIDALIDRLLASQSGE